MSAYFNQITCTIAEVVRIQFVEVLPSTQQNAEIPIALLCCHYEFLKAMRDNIDETIKQHEENMKQNRIKSN